MPVSNRLLIALIAWEVLMLATLPSRAQEISPRERALMERIGGEVNSNIACSTNVVALQDKIKDLETKLKAQEKSKVPK